MRLKLYSKWVFTVILLGMFSTAVKAQTANTYLFANSTGATLDPMTGATNIVAASVDDAPSAIQNIGFSFSYEGVAYTQFSASPDGFLKLGSPAAVDQFSNSIVSTTNVPKLFPYWDDLATGVGGGVSFVVTGASPNRILKVQWFVTIPRNTTGAANSTMQAWLYETSNIIEFRYGTGVGPSTSASIGINGVTATNFISVTTPTNATSNSTANNANTVWPGTGTMYTFAPPVPCTAPPVGGNTFSTPALACAGVNFTLAVGGSSLATGLTYQWESSPDNATWTPIATATNSTLSTTQSTPTWYRRKITCGGVDAFSVPVQVGMNTVDNCYCTAGANSTSFEKISNVTFNTINNTSSSTAGYENFTAITSTVTAGAVYPLSVTLSGGFASDQVVVFIDFNHDGDFVDAGETVFTSAISAGPFAASITIPTTATSGNTRMRVRMHDSGALLPNATSCGASSFGQVEDYTINIFVPPCVITCPANVTVNATAGQCGAIVNYPAPTTSGVCGPVTSLPASGAFFPVGTTTVTATEPGGGTCSFTVTVVDNQAPVITCPANITKNNDPSVCGSVTTFSVTATDNCSGVTVVSSPASGSVFPVGTTTVTNVATDASGNTSTCTFTVTVNDIAPPVITCPANITVSNAANQCGATVTFAPTAVDNCATINMTQSASTAIVALNSVGCPTGPNSYWRAYQLAATGPVTINTVTFGIEAATATQTLNVRVHTSAGAFPGGVLTQVATQAVTVAPADNNSLKTVTFTTPATVPANAIVVLEINAPNNPNAFFIGSNAAGQTAPSYISAAGCGAPTPVTLASLGFPGMHIILNAAGSVAVPIVSSPASGSFFPVGTTTVTSTATDASGNTATCSFTVRVNDTQAPAIVCPANITVTTAVGVCTAPATYAVTGTDNCPGVVVTRTAGPASGSAFPVGTTTVTHTATDAAGNVSTCSFTVTVLDGQLPVISAQPVNRTVCIGSNTTFTVTATNAVSYQWQQFIGGVWTNVAGATGATLNLNGVTLAMNTNSYRVNVIGLCTTVTSGFASLYVNPLPTITLSASNPPVLLPTQSTSIVATVVPAGGTFAWFKNGAPRVPTVTGNTLSNLTVEDAGTYRAVYTDPNGCVNTSADLVVSAEATDKLYIAPNPNFGQFWVRYYNTASEALTVKVFNAAGSLVYQKTSATTLAYTRIDVSLGNASPGIYLVELRGAGGRLLGSKQIIVSHR